MHNGASGQHHHGSAHSSTHGSRHSGASGHISDGRLDSQERTRSDPDVDPRLKLDNAAQFPALEGGNVSPRPAGAAAGAAQWPAKDRASGPYNVASPPATQTSLPEALSAAMPSIEDPGATAAESVAGEAAVSTTAVASAGPAAVSAASGERGPAPPAALVEAPVHNSGQDPVPPTRAWSETGGGTGAWLGGSVAGLGSGRGGKQGASTGTTPRTGPSSWSEVASFPATGAVAGRHNRNASLGSSSGFPMDPALPRAWHAGPGRMGGFHQGGQHHAMLHRRGRSVDDDRNSSTEGMHNAGRGDGKAPQPPRPVGVVNVREQ
jgi:hypothetical protein